MLFRRAISWPRAHKLVAVLLIAALASPLASSIRVTAAPSPGTQAPPSLHGFRALGAAPPDLPVLATFALPLRNVAALDSLVMQVSDPASPNYRHFITPAQAQRDFLPTAAYGSLLSYLKERGFQVVLTALDSEIVVEGTAGKFQSTFGATIDTFTNGTYSYYATTGASTFGGAYLYASNATLLFAKPAFSPMSSPGSNVTFTTSTITAKQLQPVYNATSFYSRGETGAGQTIGLFDFYGSPTVAGDLKQFDSQFGFPDATLNVIPVGPYDPSLGANVGWSTEVALDVEASHAMAPGAAIDLYVANGALPLSVPLAKIVQDDRVTSLSQSFGIFEWYYSLSAFLGGPAFVALNAIIPDQYYALGSAEGITFTASTGDGGGSGYSSGPEGDLEYPASSPFVTAVGGTQTYFAGSAGGASSFTQTAWSNIGFVPDLVNEGGGGGGVSILEPKPWYQSSQATPPSYPDGRMNPDLSLQAGVDPATAIVDSGKLVGEGGTSESSPLLAGLLTLAAQSVGGSLGLINPFLYNVGNDPAEYQKGFAPVTFGYIIPWEASYGFNLATGWGSPNMGGLAALLNATQAKTELEILGVVVNGTGGGQIDYTPGNVLEVNTIIAESGFPVTSGSFSFTLETLRGATTPVSMTYNPLTGNWTGSYTIGAQAGITDIYVSGTASDGVRGRAFGTIFAGYLGSFAVVGSPYSISFDPWSWSPSSPLRILVNATDLFGDPRPAGTVSLAVEPYSIADNSYSTSGSLSLVGGAGGLFAGSLSDPVSPGPLSLVMQGDVYGYAPTVYGIYLQTSYIYPDVAAEPGSVAPGQSLTIIATPIAPVNVYFETSYETGRTFAYDVSVGSNVTATLVSPSGGTVSSVDLAYQSCAQAVRVCNGGAAMIYGQLPVPSGTPPGLYTVLLHASYGSYTPGGNVTGSFYGQIWVANQAIVPAITLGAGALSTSATSSGSGGASLYEGEPAHVVARIDYPNGTAVRYGEYTAIVYPRSIAGQYASLMHSEYASGELIQLAFNPYIGAWVGNVTLPSATDQGSLSPLGITSADYSGPYDVYVTGLSADGVPTTAALSAQQPFFVQPYVFVTGTVGVIPETRVAFSGATIGASGNLSGDLFAGSNTVSSTTLAVSSSRIEGTLNLVGSNVTLVGVTGGDINATGANVVLKDSSIGSLSLVNSTVSMVDSSYAKVSPAPPSIRVGSIPTIDTPDQGRVAVTVTGSGLTNSSLSATIDNGLSVPFTLSANSSALTATLAIDPNALGDGVHALKITATQSDGISSVYSASFTTGANQATLNRETSTLFDAVYALAALAGVALVVAAFALLRKRAPPQV